MRAAIVVASVFLLSATARAEEAPCVASTIKHKLNFSSATLLEVVEFVSVVTCKQFIVPEKVRGGSISLTSTTALSADGVYRAFQSALHDSGLSLVPEGKFLKITSANNTGGQTSTAASKSPSRIELTLLEGKTTSSYQLTTPDKNFPSRLVLRGAEQDLSIELVWSKEGSALQYDIKRTTFSKSGSAVVDLIGTIQLPPTGKAIIVNTPTLNAELGFVP